MNTYLILLLVITFILLITLIFIGVKMKEYINNLENKINDLSQQNHKQFRDATKRINDLDEKIRKGLTESSEIKTEIKKLSEFEELK